MLKGRPAQTNRSKGPGRDRSKPLRRGDQTKAMTADRILEGSGGDSKYFTSPMARRRQYPSSWRADEHSDGGSGELSGDDLAKFHGLVLPRQEGSEINNFRRDLGRALLLSHYFLPRPTRDRPASSALSKYSSPDLQSSFSRFMSYNSNVSRSVDLDSLPSWVSDHLGEGSPYMTDEVNQSPSSPMEGSLEESPLVAVHPSVEERTNIMTLEELDALRDTYSFPSGVQVRLPDEGEIITSTRPDEVAFYEAAFPAGLRFPIHPTIRRGTRKFCSEDTPATLRGWKSKFFFVSGDEWESPEGTSRKGAARVPRMWGIPNKHCNNPPRLYGDETKVFEEIFRSVKESGRFSVPVLLESKSFHRVFVSPGSRASRTAGDNLLSGEVPSSSSDVARILRRNLARIRADPSSLNRMLKKDRREAREGCGCELGYPAPAKGVMIGKKRAGESITSLPSKKGKADDGSKGKGVDIGPEGKKKASSSSKASAAPTVVPSRPGEGTSAHLGAVPGPTPSILGSPSVAESREAGEQASLQEGRVASMETEVARLQKLAADFEQQLAESRAREQQALEELAKVKGDRDSLADHLGKSGALVNELREALNKTKESAVEEFKSSSEFMVAVEDAASKYFGKGFDFCKVQLRRHHPDLAIDLEGTVVDQDLLAELDEAEETGEHEGGKK
ncbi:hypothetical protein Acr_13g0000360 [Actinidia rufa]|uniref:Uncharacterized protein n=1 Tax=Actinidia rufa TaxID=165716 RepID=A0A7J0FIW9_9ERIC|nr:hypothetical protein Acr_13g0000360 [Actinidia rufa]